MLRARARHGIVHALRRASRRSTAWTSRCARAKCMRSMGQNGAGKSTLIKVLTGAAPAAARQISLAGQSIRAASHAGCAAPRHQHGVSGGEPLRQPARWRRTSSRAASRCRRWTRGGGIDWRHAEPARANPAGAACDVDIDVRRELRLAARSPCSRWSPSRARIDISARVLILDEPTSSLDERRGREAVRGDAQRLRDQGMAILFVTHFLDQVYAMSDRITVLRNGQLRRRIPGRGARPCRAGRGHGRARGIRVRSGRERTPATRPTPAISRPCCERANLARARQRGAGRISRSGAGEILGLAGLVRLRPHRSRAAAVRTRPRRRGRDPRGRASPSRSAIRRRPSRIDLALLPGRAQDRGHRRRPLDPRQHRADAAGAHGPVAQAASSASARELTDRLARLLDIRAASLDVPIGELSGGNQQKCLIARALAHESAPADPRRAHARHRRRRQAGDHEPSCSQLAAQGMALLFISAEVDELLRVSRPRIVVMRDRRQAGSLPGGCARTTTVYALHRAARAEAVQTQSRRDAQAAGRLPLFWPCATLALLVAAQRLRRIRAFSRSTLARRPPVRQPHRHPEPRGAAGAGRRSA